MMTRQDYRDTWSFIKWGMFVLFVCTIGAFLWAWMTSPARVVTKTLDPNNVIASYEWFFDTATQINARVAQANAHRKLVDAEKVASERSRLTIELAGMQQSCRDMVAKYNANAGKANKSIFKTDATPASFNPLICE